MWFFLGEQNRSPNRKACRDWFPEYIFVKRCKHSSHVLQRIREECLASEAKFLAHCDKLQKIIPLAKRIYPGSFAFNMPPHFENFILGKPHFFCYLFRIPGAAIFMPIPIENDTADLDRSLVSLGGRIVSV